MIVFACALILAAVLPGPVAAGGPTFSPGASGAGDPYYPLDGNGGYDVKHYDLDLGYAPSTGVLTGRATIDARATQNLSRFDLDFVGLTVRSIKVGGRPAAWTRDGQELIITPARGILKGDPFQVVIRYDGVPEPTVEFGGSSGFIATDDGFDVAGQPHGAATWFPANDHPTDKASFTFEITVPKALEVVANGRLVGKDTHGSLATWTWDAPDPMATYLATVNVGQFDIHAYRKNGIRYWDALDPDLLTPVASPHGGSQFAYSQMEDLGYKRLARTISVPSTGATLRFWVNRHTETNWDFFFVEAHHPGQDDWTTLPDQGGATSDDTGFSCPFGGWQSIHPFLAHYQTDNGDGTCTPTGTTGDWNAATGDGTGWEQWTIDLGDYANGDVEISLAYASDETVQFLGVFVDDITVSTGAGSTGFEADGDTMDGWTVPGAPTGSPGTSTDWIVGPASIGPPPAGDNVNQAFARQPEILGFLGSKFGPYPWSYSGGIVDDVEGLGFALETQTRPIYAKDFFQLPDSEGVVVHELAHQWYGDNLAVKRWSEIWLNEGFATYAEWLWSEHIGQDTPQDIFDFYMGAIADDDPFWSLTIGDPGAGSEFDFAVYARGAMTLQALRTTVGDDDFFTILRKWAKSQAGGNVTTAQFIALAEKVSGQDLGDLFDTWLYTPSKPVFPMALARRGAAASVAKMPPVVRGEFERYGRALLDRVGG